MVQHSEEQAIHEVRLRLHRQFPRLSEDVVAASVSRSYAALTGPVRAYVPLLVEHDARDQLRSMASRLAHSPA